MFSGPCDEVNPVTGRCASPRSGATAHFFKEFLQGAYYIPLTARTVVALSGRVGLIQSKGGTTSSDVPLSERFTAGGEVSHRGFGLDQLGDLCRSSPETGYIDLEETEGCEPTLYQRPTLREDGTTNYDTLILPRGGSGMLLLNAEYRFPMFSTLGGAVFVDAGNVYKTDRIDFDNMRYGVGFGFRYLSPVGPLRIDIAHPLERRWYEDQLQYFVTLGYAF